MNPNTQTVLGLVAALAFLAGGGYYIYQDIRAPGLPETDIVSPVSTTTSLNETPSAVIAETPGVVYTSGAGIAGAAAAPNTPVPDLNRAVTFGTEFSSEAQEIMREKIMMLQDALKSNPLSFKEWLNLGIYRKQIGDYEGARQAWEYAGALQLENNLPFLNLGILYHYYLKDFPKAEGYLLISLKNSPAFPETYKELGELYRYSYKTDTSAAVDVLKQGIVKTGHTNLMVQLARYYQEVKNDSANAKIYFTQARDSALKNGDTKLASALDEEINALQ